MLNGSVVPSHYGVTSQHQSTSKPGDVLSVIQTKYRISFKSIGECSCTRLQCAFQLAVVSHVTLLVRQSSSPTSSFSLMQAHLPLL